MRMTKKNFAKLEKRLEEVEERARRLEDIILQLVERKFPDFTSFNYQFMKNIFSPNQEKTFIFCLFKTTDEVEEKGEIAIPTIADITNKIAEITRLPFWDKLTEDLLIGIFQDLPMPIIKKILDKNQIAYEILPEFKEWHSSD